MAAEVRIWLLGGFRVGIDSRQVPDDAWRRNKAKAVVKLLALAPSHRLHREQLMDVLWPELPPDAAAANLRKAVHFVRQALAPEHLQLRQEVLQLAAERLRVDVQAFQEAAQAGDLAAAIDLYAGELLPEDRFEPWAEQHREQLGARFSRLLLERAAELEAAGDLRGAAGALERLAAVDPLNEPAATGLMRCTRWPGSATSPLAEKQVLQQAAVVGRVFWEEPVERALGGTPVAAELHELERRGFLVRRPATTLSGQAELVFRHALIHDVAYASIRRARRARAHAEVGAWLEELAGDRRDEFAELLAHHFGRAAAGDGAELAWTEPAGRERVRAAAFAHLLRAGAMARRVAVSKAVELHEQARTLAGSERERLLALEELGDDHESAYHGEQAVAWWLQALAIARSEGRSSGDPSGDRARLCRKVAWLMASTPGAFRVNPEPAAVEQFVAEGLAAATDEASRAWMLVARGMTAQLWRGSEPFGQGRQPDPVPVDKFREGRLYGPQHAFALLEALLALEDLPAVAELLPTARTNLAGNALLAPACDRGEGLLHANAGQRREAARALRAAVGGFERLGCRSRRRGPGSTSRRSCPPRPPGRCWRLPARPTSGWAPRPATRPSRIGS